MGGTRRDGAGRVHAIFSPAHTQDPWVSGELVVCVRVDAVCGGVLCHGVGVVEGGSAAGVGDETSVISAFVSRFQMMRKWPYLSSPRESRRGSQSSSTTHSAPSFCKAR